MCSGTFLNLLHPTLLHLTDTFGVLGACSLFDATRRSSAEYSFTRGRGSAREERRWCAHTAGWIAASPPQQQQREEDVNYRHFPSLSVTESSGWTQLDSPGSRAGGVNNGRILTPHAAAVRKQTAAF